MSLKTPKSSTSVMLEKVMDIATRFVAREGTLPDRLDPSESGIGLQLGSRGRTMDQVAEAVSDLMMRTPSSASPRFLNQLFGGRDPVATMAEMLTPLSNTSMYTFKVAGPHVLVEREVLRHMMGKVGYENGEGNFTPGGSLANLVAMLVARNESVPGFRENGANGSRLTVYTSAAGHYSTRKNAGILGIGRANVRMVSTDREGRMVVRELDRLLREDREEGAVPVLINGTAGTTVHGSFDPLRELADLAREHRIWLHVDGAFGGSVLLSRNHRHLLDGIGLSDSFTWCAHKMLGVPLSCSVLLMRRRGLLLRNLSEAADYLFQADRDDLNPGVSSLQCGRRNDALKLWAAWMHHGDEGYDARIGRMFELAQYAARRIDADPNLSLTFEPPSVNVCFEVPGRSSAAICDRLDMESRLKIGHGTVDGRCAIRLVTVNPDLKEEDIDYALREIKNVAMELPQEDGGLMP